MHNAALECEEMASAYLEDGRHFRDDDDLVNALASFSYGHAWLDAGARWARHRLREFTVGDRGQTCSWFITVDIVSALQFEPQVTKALTELGPLVQSSKSCEHGAVAWSGCSLT